MPYVIAENRLWIDDKMQRLSRSLGLNGHGTDAVLEWILSLRAELAIPHTLAEIGLDDTEATYLGQMAVTG